MGKRRLASKLLSVLTVVSMLILSLPGVAYATTEQISQTTCNSTSPPFWTFAQSFTPVKPGTIDSVVLRLIAFYGVSEDLTVEIHSMPIGPASLLGTSDLQVVLPGNTADINDYTNYTFTFASPVAVEAGVSYALVAYDVDMVGICFCYQDTSVYNDGALLLYFSDMWNESPLDRKSVV